MLPYVGFAGVTQELRDYYKNRFHFEDVDFVPVGSYGSIFPEDQFGRITLVRDGLTKQIVIGAEGFWQQGWDGIDSIMEYADKHWTTDPKEILKRVFTSYADPGDETNAK